MRKMKTILALVCITASVILTGLSRVQAQDSPEHVYHINIAYSVSGLDSAQRAERNAILKEYHEKVTMKNEFILHMYTMGHYFSEDSREFVTVTEYASWADIDKGIQRDGELEKMAWPDAARRKAFLKKMNDYFPTHKDGVYHAMPDLMK